MTLLAILATLGLLMIALQWLVRLIGRSEISFWNALVVAAWARLAGRAHKWIMPNADWPVKLAISLGLIALATTLAVHFVSKVAMGRSLVISLIYTALAIVVALVMVAMLPSSSTLPLPPGAGSSAPAASSGPAPPPAPVAP